MSVAILCPTKARPDECKRMIDSVNATTKYGNVNIYIAVQDYNEEYDFLRKYSNVRVYFAKDWTTAYSWNFLADEAAKDRNVKFFMLGADDIIFSTPKWDDVIEKHESETCVVSFLDSRDSDGTPHPIVSRGFYEKLGYFVPPIFLHWYVDTWIVSIAKACDMFHHIKDYMVIHNKPSDIGKPDETHTGIRNRGWHQRDEYTWKKCQHLLACEISRMSNR